MRTALVLVVGMAAGCGAPRQAPAPAVPVAPVVVRTCNEAAAGIERGTRLVRAPEVSVLEDMRTACFSDGWTREVIECFAAMSDDPEAERGLGACAAQLSRLPRERMFRALAGLDDRAAIAVARTRLAAIEVGIAECDRFVAAVENVLVCDRMAIDVRARLGSETAELWTLPLERLPAEAQQRMAAVCGSSLDALRARAAEAGCMP